MNGFEKKQGKTEVLVVGAGPVGLMATSLANCGVLLLR